MKRTSLIKDLEYNENKPAVKVLMDTNSSREIRIAMRKGQIMKEHKTPFPIVVEIFEGRITFGVHGKSYDLEKGDLVYLDGDVPHDLKAEQNSTVRLTLSKLDSVERVKEVAITSS